jgi:adenosylcobinamide-phosphate synthase
MAAGWLADLLIGDPRRAHPVALFGRLATALERATYRDSRPAGGLYTGVSLIALGLTVEVLQRCAARFGAAGRIGVTAAATWAALGGTSLARTGDAMADVLSNGDVDAARRLLPSLCGRDPHALDARGLTRAALESVAENTSDATVAPLMWAAVAGVPGVAGYRGVNTLDAMVGHRSARYLRFGWAAARLDDVANYLPARATAVLTALCAPAVGGSSTGALRAWRRDAARHPSPNAGVVEAAFAGALGVRLGGPTRYAHALQIRPTLGAGPEPTVDDLRRAVRLSRLVQLAAAIVTTVATATTLSAAGRSGRRASPRW